MEQAKIQTFGNELYEAMIKREAVSPLTMPTTFLCVCWNAARRPVRG